MKLPLLICTNCHISCCGNLRYHSTQEVITWLFTGSSFLKSHYFSHSRNFTSAKSWRDYLSLCSNAKSIRDVSQNLDNETKSSCIIDWYHWENICFCNLVELSLYFSSSVNAACSAWKKQKNKNFLHVVDFVPSTNRLLFACVSACLALALPATRGSVWPTGEHPALPH